MRALPLFAFLMLAGTAQAQSVGEALYQSRCGGCHGPNAQGDGPMAALLTVAVPDLTQLAQQNGQRFPLLDVVRTIDGRQSLRGHGGGPMPVFGTILGGGSAVLDMPDGTVLQTRGDVLAIAGYLESLQAD